MTGRKGEPIPVEQINEQHPHRGDWLRELLFWLLLILTVILGLRSRRKKRRRHRGPR